MTSQLEQELHDLQQNARTLTKEVRDLFESNIEWLKGETSLAVDEFRQIAIGFNDEVVTRTRAARKRQLKQPVNSTRKRAPLQPVVNNTTLPIRETRSQRRKRNINTSTRSSPSIYADTNNTSSPIRKTRRTRTRKQKIKESPTTSKPSTRQLIADDVRRFEPSKFSTDLAPKEDQVLSDPVRDDDREDDVPQKRVTRKKKKQPPSKSSAATNVIDLTSDTETCETTSVNVQDVPHSERKTQNENQDAVVSRDSNDFIDETAAANEIDPPRGHSQSLQEETFQDVEEEDGILVASEKVVANESNGDNAVQFAENDTSTQQIAHLSPASNRPSSVNDRDGEDLAMEHAEVDEYDSQNQGRQSDVVGRSTASDAHENISTSQEPAVRTLASESQRSYQLLRTSTEKTISVRDSELSGGIKTRKGRAKKVRNKSGSSIKTEASTARSRNHHKRNISSGNEHQDTPQDLHSPTHSSVANYEQEPSTPWEKKESGSENDEKIDYTEEERISPVQQSGDRQSTRDDDELLESPQPSSSGSDSEEDTPIMRRFNKAPSSFARTRLQKQAYDDPHDSEGTENKVSHESPKSSVETESDRDDEPSFETPSEELFLQNNDDDEENIVNDTPADKEILADSSPTEDAEDPEPVPSSLENELKSLHRDSTATNLEVESKSNPKSKIINDVSKDGAVLESSPKNATYKTQMLGNVERTIAEIAVKTAIELDGNDASKPTKLPHKFKINENGQVTGDGLGILSKIVSGPTSSEQNEEDGTIRRENIPTKSLRSGRLFKPTKDIYSSHRKPLGGSKQTVQRSKETAKGNVLSHTPGARAPLSLIKDSNEVSSFPNNSNNVGDIPNIAPNEISRGLHLAQNDTQSTPQAVKENQAEKPVVSDPDRPLPGDKRMVSFKVALKERLEKKAKKSVEFEERRDSLAYIGPSRLRDSENADIEPMTAPVNKMHGRIQPQSSARPKSALRCRIEAFREGKMSNAAVSKTPSAVVQAPSADEESNDAPSSNSLLPSSFSVGRVKSPTSFSHVPKAIQGLPPGLRKTSHGGNNAAEDDSSLTGQRKSSDKFEEIPSSPSQESSEGTPEEDIAIQRTARDSSLSLKEISIASPSSSAKRSSSPNHQAADFKLQTSQIESQSIPTQSTPEPPSSEPKPILSNLAGSVKSFLPDSFFAPRTGEKRRSSSDPEVIAKRQRLEEERREAELATRREAQRIAKQGIAEERQKRAEARRKLMAEAERAKEEQRRVKEERRLEKKREEERERRRQKEAEDRKKEERRKQILLKHKAMKERENKRVKKGLEKGHGSNYKKVGTLGSTATEDEQGHDSGGPSKLKKVRTDSDHSYLMRSPPADEIKARQSTAGPSSYVITPARDDSEFELSDEEEERRRGKSIPNWAKTPRLASSFENQVDPDEFFVNVPKCDLSDVFGRRKRYNKVRSSSGNWTRDRITAKEAMAYRKYFDDSDEDE